MKKIKLILPIIFVLYIGYFGFRSYRISSQSWKYSDGAYFGDFPEFDANFSEVFNDTLYQSGVPVAKLIDYQFRIVDDVILIETIKETMSRDKVGRYCSK